MIPKRLIFMWFGDQIPEYAFYSMHFFNKVNPSFRIDFIHRTCEDIDGLKDTILEESLSLIKLAKQNPKSTDDNLYFDKFNMSLRRHQKAITILSDVYRMLYINKYGGIYIDCDTFPVKPFDDDLIKKKFMVYHYDKKPPYYDNFFIGAEPGEFCSKDQFSNRVNYRKPDHFEMYRKKFFNLELTLDDIANENGYLIHLQKYSWNPKCNIVQNTNIDKDVI